MTCGHIPDEDRIVHYVKPSKIHEDGTIDGSEFMLRPVDKGLSGNWLDYFAFLPSEERLEAVAVKIQRDPNVNNGKFAEWNVGALREHLLTESHAITVVHDPSPANERYGPDPSHCQMYGLPPQDTPEAQLVGDMMAEFIQKLHDIPRVKR
jgi:hypothetical protein